MFAAALVPGDFLTHSVGLLLIPTVGPAFAVSGFIVYLAWKDRRMERDKPESVEDAEEPEEPEAKSERGALRVILGVTLALAVGLVSACGSDVATKPPNSSTAPKLDDSPVKIDVIIAGGDVRPKAARVNIRVGQKVVFAVTSDVADVLHVHSDPAQSFKIQPGPYQEFAFTINVPGQVEVEAEDLGISIATLVVRP